MLTRQFVLIIAGMATVVALIMLILWLAWLRKSYPDYLSTSAMLVNLVSVFVAFIRTSSVSPVRADPASRGPARLRHDQPDPHRQPDEAGRRPLQVARHR